MFILKFEYTCMTKEFRHKTIFLLILIPKIGATEHIHCMYDTKNVHYTSNDLPTLS